ncbi:MAG TPA: DUF305 domain-containing protein [Actinophytocola sp.]|jgi:uncharacterized protein (DUF305 family)|nr:DUF305 domain-containing protein [Actinophytocola sp.]
MVTRLLLAVLLVTGLAACAQQAPPPAAPAPAARPAPSAPPGGFGATEQAFTQLEIATDDQALRMLGTGARRASSARLRGYAAALAGARRAELAELHGLLDAAGVRYQNLHAGHDMPGMPTNAELIGLDAASDFDATLVDLVRAHLSESATVARSAAREVAHPATRDLASRMASARAASLAELGRLG